MCKKKTSCTNSQRKVWSKRMSSNRYEEFDTERQVEHYWLCTDDCVTYLYSSRLIFIFEYLRVKFTENAIDAPFWTRHTVAYATLTVSQKAWFTPTYFSTNKRKFVFSFTVSHACAQAYAYIYKYIRATE